jgi:hypothetical protein
MILTVFQQPKPKCKMMVYDFIHYDLRPNSIDNGLWVPPHNLKGKSGYNLKKLFQDQYFAENGDGPLAETLWGSVHYGGDKTVLIHDVLDEKSQELNSETRRLVHYLLDYSTSSALLYLGEVNC